MATADGLDAIADRLYALPPADFTAARDGEAKTARLAGDRARADGIGKLRRPTVAAWMVNLLALRHPETIDELLELGVALRQAQQELRGPALRDLTTRRRAAVLAMVRESVELAISAGAKRSTLPVAEVETTLTAALADADLAQVVRAGRLLKSGAYDGFGEVPRPDLRVVPDDGDPTAARSAAKSAPKSAPKPAATVQSTGAVRSPADKRAPAAPVPADNVDTIEARKRLDGAAANLADAEAAYADAVMAVDERAREVAEIEDRLTQLRADRRTAHAAVLSAQAASDAADAARQAAQRRHAAAVRAAKRQM